LSLPRAAPAAGVYYGAGVLKEHTVAEAEGFVGQIRTGAVDQLLSSLQSGVAFPGREDIISVLNTVKDKTIGQEGDDGQQGGSDQPGDQQEEPQDGAGQEGGSDQEGAPNPEGQDGSQQ